MRIKEVSPEVYDVNIVPFFAAWMRAEDFR
jgi:hypothetical protein